MVVKRRLTPPRDLEKLTFRVASPFREKILKQAEAARMSPNELGRLATYAAVDGELFAFHERLTRIERSLERLYEEFLRALE